MDSLGWLRSPVYRDLPLLTLTAICQPFPSQHSVCLPGHFPVVKNPAASAGDLRDVGTIPGSERSPQEGNGSPLQYYCMENLMDRRAWWATVHAMGSQRVGHDLVTEHNCVCLWRNAYCPPSPRCSCVFHLSYIEEEREYTYTQFTN